MLNVEYNKASFIFQKYQELNDSWHLNSCIIHGALSFHDQNLGCMSSHLSPWENNHQLSWRYKVILRAVEEPSSLMPLLCTTSNISIWMAQNISFFGSHDKSRYYLYSFSIVIITSKLISIIYQLYRRCVSSTICNIYVDCFQNRSYNVLTKCNHAIMGTL